MPGTFGPACVDLATPSVEQALGYYSDVLGTTVVERSGDAAFLSLGLDHHDIALRGADRPGLAAIGLQLSAGADPDELRRRLEGLA